MKNQFLKIQLKVCAIFLLGTLWGGISVWQFFCQNHWAIALLLIIPVCCIAGALMAQIEFLAKLGLAVQSYLIKDGDSVTVLIRGRNKILSKMAGK